MKVWIKLGKVKKFGIVWWIPNRMAADNAQGGPCGPLPPHGIGLKLHLYLYLNEKYFSITQMYDVIESSSYRFLPRNSMCDCRCTSIQCSWVQFQKCTFFLYSHINLILECRQKYKTKAFYEQGRTKWRNCRLSTKTPDKQAGCKETL